MTPIEACIEALSRPVAYASRDGHARLHTLKGFEALVGGVVRRAEEAGIPTATLAPLRQAAAGFDGATPAERKARLEQVSAWLARAAQPAAPQVVVKPAVVRPPAAVKSPAAPPVVERPPATKPVVAKPVAVKAPAPKRNARKRKAEPSVEDEVGPRWAVRAGGPLATPLAEVVRIPARLVPLLEKKGLRSVGDVLALLPRTYEDRRHLATVAQLVPGERGATLVTVKHVEESYRGKGRVLRVVFGDATGTFAGTYFQYAPWMKSRFGIGKRMVVSGQLKASLSGREMAHPEIEPADDAGDLTGRATLHFERVVPVYPGFERGEQRGYRELAHAVVSRFAPQVDDPLPASLRARADLPLLSEVLSSVHFPPNEAPLEPLVAWQSPWHRRLAFEELFFLQLGLGIRRMQVKRESGIAFAMGPDSVAKAAATLPFKLTLAQTRVLADIAGDMARAEPMNRLLQGDVGSGKTAVALVACRLAIAAGYQTVLMAPTEILAEQHLRTVSRLLGPQSGIELGLLSGSLTPAQKRESRMRLEMGRTQLVVGTHALLEESVRFRRLGLAVIDEQHRFGVVQRAALRAKGAEAQPDVLVMTATPIPRTLAMAAYGDLDLSVIDELPPGRTPIRTRVFTERSREKAYALMAEELGKGRQAYVVFPLVEESEKVDLADATEGAERLAALFPGRRVGLLHGRMKSDEKDEVMRAFREHALDLLVATTVVEVGVDVPNATVILIEAADRFGLSQLHQLRGRVGRGQHASHCLLLPSGPLGAIARERLGVMEESTDGFVIAQKDLELRGPGELLGTRQAGLPELSVANLARDQELLALAQKEALAIAQRDPVLHLPEHRPLARALRERWEGKLALAEVG